MKLPSKEKLMGVATSILSAALGAVGFSVWMPKFPMFSVMIFLLNGLFIAIAWAFWNGWIDDRPQTGKLGPRFWAMATVAGILPAAVLTLACVADHATLGRFSYLQQFLLCLMVTALTVIFLPSGRRKLANSS